MPVTACELRDCLAPRLISMCVLRFLIEICRAFVFCSSMSSMLNICFFSESDSSSRDYLLIRDSYFFRKKSIRHLDE